MRDRLIAGEPADLLILTQALIAELARSGHAVPGSARDLGVVRTAIAKRAADAMPDVSDATTLGQSLVAADEIYLPDPKLATAGIHFARVLDHLGIAGTVEARLRPYPNGQAAMQAMAQSRAQRVIGCTQVTEILATPGVVLVAPLPKAFELATTYVAAVAGNAAWPDMARRLADLLAGPGATGVRERAGFETR